MHDRIRAKAPNTDTEKWKKGTVDAVDTTVSPHTVTVQSEDGDMVTLTITTAIYDLFTKRLESETPLDETVYYKKKGT